MLGAPGVSPGLSTGSGQAGWEGSGYQECGAGLPAAPVSCSSVFGNARAEGPGMDVTKTLGNNVLLRFGTRLCALQNVIKILLMGQRGVETHGGKAARSRRAHMGAGRPCVQRREGGRQPGRASILPLPSLHPFLTCLSPSWPSSSTCLCLFFPLLCLALGMPKLCCCPLPNGAADDWAGMPAGMRSVWERKYSKIPSSSRDTGQDTRGGVALCVAVVAGRARNPVPAPSLPHGYLCLPGDGGKGTGRGQAALDWQRASGSGLASFLCGCHCSGWRKKGEKTCGLTENDMERQPN